MAYAVKNWSLFSVSIDGYMTGGFFPLIQNFSLQMDRVGQHNTIYLSALPFGDIEGAGLATWLLV